MKHINSKFFANIIISIVCITTIALVGLKQDMLYDDSAGSNHSFSLVNSGNVKVEYIEGVVSNDGMMRVQNGVPYSVAISIGGETETYEAFTFESDLNDVVFNMSYDSRDNALYMNRTLFMVKSFYSVSLLALVILAIQVIYYVSFVFSFKVSSDIEADVYEQTLPERLMRIPTMVLFGLLAVVGLLFFLEIFINLEYFLYEISDTLLLMISGGIMVFLLVGSFYTAVIGQHYQFTFGRDTLTVKNKGKDLFTSPYDNLVVEERLTQNSGAINKYTSMILILKSREVQSRAVEMNLLFLGVKNYNILVQKLHGLAKGLDNDSISSEIPIEEGRFFVKKRANQGLMLAILILFTVALTFTMIIFVDVSPALLIGLMISVPLVVIVLAVLLILPKNKEVHIKVDLGGITINDQFIEASSIKSITMTRPTIGNTMPSALKIKHTSGKINYAIALRYKKEDFSEAYRRLYVSVNKNYGEVLNK